MFVLIRARLMCGSCERKWSMLWPPVSLSTGNPGNGHDDESEMMGRSTDAAGGSGGALARRVQDCESLSPSCRSLLMITGGSLL